MTTDISELRNQLVATKIDHQQTRVLLEQTMAQLRLVQSLYEDALTACAAATIRELEYQSTSQEMVALVLPHIKVLIREAMIGRDGIHCAGTDVPDSNAVAEAAEIEDAICIVGNHYQLGAEDLEDLIGNAVSGGPLDARYQVLTQMVEHLETRVTESYWEGFRNGVKTQVQYTQQEKSQ